jgi:uncharacterized LabA/DUF88 family protein
MEHNENNFAYIDGANLDKGIRSLNWLLDYNRFRKWLAQKYSVKSAFIFIGMIPKYNNLYTKLQEAGFTLIFKQVVYDGDGKPKGNCDADLVVRVMQDTYENNYNKAIIVTSDGDYAGLLNFLLSKNKLETVLSPALVEKCSVLIKRTNAKIAYLNDQQSILSFTKRKSPR